MRKTLLVFTLGILLLSFVSADIVITQQPDQLYNLGDIAKTPVKITTIEGIENFFSALLICNGIETEVHKQYISLPAGEEQEINIAIPLITSFIGRTTGTCIIKPVLGEEYSITDEFIISDLININLDLDETEFKPEQEIIITGDAIKENSENVKGFVDLTIIADNSTDQIKVSNTVKNGFFSLNFSMPEKTKAGQYLVKLEVYEKEDESNKTNYGFTDFNILITQVPTSLELIINEPVMPGENLQLKTVLHDQTGEKIESSSGIIIKNSLGELIEQTQIATDEYLSIPIAYNEAPTEWSVEAFSNNLETQEEFNISENEKADVNIINKTIIIENKGNVPFNETLIINIGNTTMNLNSYLEVDETEKFKLTAPEGEYEVEVNNKGEKITKTVFLTGKAVDVESISNYSLVKKSLIWIIVILILIAIIYLIFKKGYQKSFFAYMTKKKNQKKETIPAPIKQSNPLIDFKEKAELSLSIKGNKQTADIICVKVKNKKELNDAARQRLTQIAETAHNQKAAIYENQDSLFFILSPIKTKTFKNHKISAEISQGVKKSLDAYNKLAKQKIDYGISLNEGTIIAKLEKNKFQFMSLGTLMALSRKIASISDGKILVSKDLNQKFTREIKTKKLEKNDVYEIQEVKKTKEETKKFINDFIKKLDK